MFRRHSPEPIWLPADAVRGQAAEHALQGFGPYGGHVGMSQGGDVVGRNLTGCSFFFFFLIIKTVFVAL